MNNRAGVILLILSLINSSLTEVIQNDDDPTLVTLPEGQIKGHTLPSPNEKTYYAFQEIPFAAPPVGEFRFMEPQPPQKWDGILNTTQNTKICHQAVNFGSGSGTIQTEDCLYLNVYTPVKPGDSSETLLPVLIYVYGGAFRTGSGDFQSYKPQYFIDHNIVIVTLNYRVGPLGFLTTQDGVIPGNVGLKDQRMAFQWVKKNINLFGGDPEKVTISGESAGAISSGLHIVSPKNKGLFRAAVMQSSTALHQSAHQDFARFYAFELGRSLDPNFTSDNSTELLKLLQSVAASDISVNNITADIGKETDILEGEGYIWLPVIEENNSEGALLTTPYHEEIKNGNINRVPILIGFNSEENLSMVKDDPSLPESRAKYLDNDVSNMIRNKYNMTKENKVTAGTQLRQIYTEGLFQDNPGQVIKFFSDQEFTTPIIRHAKLQSNYTDVFLYQFSYKGEMGGMKDVEIAGVRGVGHAEDVNYFWDSFNTEGTTYGPEDLLERQRLLTMWFNFVKYLNPTPEKDSLQNNVTWEKVTPNNLVYLNINDTLEMKTNPKEYIKWKRIVDVFAIPPLINY